MIPGKWQEAKILIGSAMYIDSLKAPSLLGKALQGDKADIVECQKNVLHSKSVDTPLPHRCSAMANGQTCSGPRFQ